MIRTTTLLLAGVLALQAVFHPVQAETIDKFSSVKIPGALTGYVDLVYRPTIFLSIPKLTTENCPDYLSREQALQDLEMINCLFDDAYSGRFYWENHGVNFPEVYKNISDYIGSVDRVSVAEIEKILADGFSGIIDGHFAFCGNKMHTFYRHKNACFSDLLVEKKGNDYVVIQSGVSGVIAGDLVTDAQRGKFLFQTLAASSREQFLIGTLSYEKIDSITIGFSSGNRKLFLHDCRINESDNGGEVFAVSEREGVPVVRVSTFDFGYDQKLTEYAEYGKILKDKSCFVVNLLSNQGGSDTYSEEFVTNLNGCAHLRLYYAALSSPPVMQSWANLDLENSPDYIQEIILNARKEVETLKKKPVVQWEVEDDSGQQTGNYQGKALFLSNRRSASASEDTLLYSESIPNAVIVGENSGGVATFGEVREYELPNSRIRFLIPSKILLTPGLEEGVGYLPDYWLDSSEPVKEAAAWLKHPESYQFRLEIPAAVEGIDFERWEDADRSCR
ncbi:MAG: S41 family peptidase [Candidatus Wallbacteria bacterium]|nr:S41 family peptidase [Candidatus Wallbacteria bacterium]